MLLNHQPTEHTTPAPAAYRKPAVLGLNLSLAALQAALPQPELPERPALVALYWRCWELAAQKVRHGSAENGFSATYIDAAFGGNIFQWDTCFIAAFARYSRELLPVLPALDNFYRLQEPDGYIAREYRWENGAPLWAKPSGDSINPPLFAWAEWQLYRIHADRTRLSNVWPHLDGYFRYLQRVHRNHDGTYWITDMGSGMDNTPRYGAGWLDLTCQQALNARMLALIAQEIDNTLAVEWYTAQHRELAAVINSRMWDAETGWYWDVDTAGLAIMQQTIANFWPLLADVTSDAQTAQLVAHLRDPATFWRTHPFPTLAANHVSYRPHGEYWLGAVWAPTNYMVIKGLEHTGQHELAREATLRHLDAIERVYRTTDTVWENYRADEDAPGTPARPDFVGWTGCGPIALLIEQVIGVLVDAPQRRIQWTLREPGAHGLRNLPFGADTVDLVMDDAGKLSVHTTGELTLVIDGQRGSATFSLAPGAHTLSLT